MKSFKIFLLTAVCLLSLAGAGCSNTPASTDSSLSSEVEEKVYPTGISVSESAFSALAPVTTEDKEQIKALVDMLSDCTYTLNVNSEHESDYPKISYSLNFYYNDSALYFYLDHDFNFLRYDGKFYNIAGFDESVWNDFYKPENPPAVSGPFQTYPAN